MTIGLATIPMHWLRKISQKYASRVIGKKGATIRTAPAPILHNAEMTIVGRRPNLLTKNKDGIMNRILFSILEREKKKKKSLPKNGSNSSRDVDSKQTLVEEAGGCDVDRSKRDKHDGVHDSDEKIGHQPHPALPVNSRSSVSSKQRVSLFVLNHVTPKKTTLFLREKRERKKKKH